MTAKKKSSLTIDGASVDPVHPRITFIKSIKFGGIGLDRSNSSVDRALLAQALANQEDLEIEVTINQSVLESADDYFIVAAEFGLAQRSKGSEAAIVSIAATFSARFNLTAPANDDLIKGFAGLEARLIFFPYLRHFVSDISYRMSIESIVLPMTSELEK